MSDFVRYCPYPEDVHQVVLTEILGSKDPDYIAAPSFFFFQFHKPLQYFCFLFSCLFLPPLWCWFLPLPVERMGGRDPGKCQEWGSCCIWPGQKLPSAGWAGLLQNVAEFLVKSVKALGASREKILSCRDQLWSSRVGSMPHGGAVGAPVRWL